MEMFKRKINLSNSDLSPAKDPCLYILRFAAQLDFGKKTQQVANTALRLVQRMKRDSIHSGRRPSGLCGAALLIASRLHEFGRSASDVVKIVKVHESTLRKRLIEFGDTPTSALTLEEFMTVDLEEDQDPPSFKAARKKDKERLLRLMEEEADSITELQRQIESQLSKNKSKPFIKNYSPSSDDYELRDTERFIHQNTLGAIRQIMGDENVDDPDIVNEPEKELGPNIASMGLANSLDDTSNSLQPAAEPIEVDMTFDELDDDELDTYIMSENEFQHKNGLWHKRNAAYLEAQKSREERIKKEKEEGKPEKKKRKAARKKAMGPSNSAGEAIEKILQERKISMKINYDVLKSLNTASIKNESVVKEESEAGPEDVKRRRLSSTSSVVDKPIISSAATKPKKKGKNKATSGLPFVEETKEEEKPKGGVPEVSEEEMEDDFYEEEQPQESTSEMGVLQMLRQHRDDDEEAEDYFNYEEDY